MTRQCLIFKRRKECAKHGKVNGRVFHLQTTCDIQEDILGTEVESAALFQDG